MSDAGPTQAEIQALRRRGALVLSAFALVWAAAGISAVESSAAAIILWPVAVVTTAITVGLALQRGPASMSDEPHRMTAGWRRRLGLVNLLQAAGICLAIALLVRLGQASLIPAVVCAIVGLHFLPLARIFGESLYTWTGVVLVIVSMAGVVVLGVADGLLSRAVVGLGAAAVLWASSLSLTRRS